MSYPWTRFWCPREGSINLSDGGFLFDPESEHAEHVAPDVVPFAQISHLPCLALLGEPGIGKSTAMEDLRDVIQQAVQASGERLLYVNLNEYGEESRLIDDVFDSPAFQEWLAGTHCLHLFLDSLDECRILVPKVGAIVARRLEQAKEHLDRLRLRIACRTTEWPATLEEAIPDLWGENDFGAYELVPLRRRDVQVAAEEEGIDPERFFAELRRTESIPLAIKPITLKFLLSVFKSHGQFPTSRQELYELGCLRLCEEANPLRQDLRLHGGTGHLSAEQRMATASRIAAVSLFCRKPVITTGDLPARASAEKAPIASFVGGSEPVGAEQVDASDDAIREVVGTGLFSSRGPGRMGFAHQTYAEFLASRYLAMHMVPPDKVLALLRHPDDPDGRIVPQLHETAAWIAGTNSDILRAIVHVDPQVLLRGDAANLTEADRRLIVNALLLALEERRATDRDWGLYRHYFKLEHVGLAEQLRAWMVDSGKYFIVRHVAIDIAEACECRELLPLLADMALDQSEALRLRISAARAVGKIGDADMRGSLRPLAIGQGGDDPQDELKGCALRALWPGLISAEDLFKHLTIPKKPNTYGAYAGFLASDLLEHLADADLPHALGWLRTLASQKHLTYGLQCVSDGIMVKAWTSLAAGPILDALAPVCIEFFNHYHALIHDNDILKEHSELFDDSARRRLLAAKVVGICQDRTTHFGLTNRSPNLIRLEDLDWCVERLRQSVGDQTEPRWAELVWSLFCWGQPGSHRLELLIAARAQSSRLHAESDLFFAPVELGSKRAQKMRTDHAAAHEDQTEPTAQLLSPPPRRRIEKMLERSEKGEVQAWGGLLCQMTLEDTSTRYSVVPLDVRNLPGWKKADAPTKRRMLASAEHFVQSSPVDPLKWLREPHRWGSSDTAAYSALLLLKNEAPETYDALPEWVWGRHMATVLCSPLFNPEEDVKSEHEAVALKCYQQAKSEMLSYLPMQIDAEDRVRDYISCAEKLGQCWDEDLKQAVHKKLVQAQGYWREKTFDRVAALLLIHEHQPTRDLLVEMVGSVTEGTCGNLGRAKIAAAGLIAHSSDAAWSIVWVAALANREFGRDLLMSVAHGLHHKTAEVASKLTDDQLGALFVWLAKEFPYSEDREHGGVYSPDRDDSARDFRDGVLSFLGNRGTPASVQAIQHASESLPELDWLRSTLVEARKNALRKTWRPCTPAEFLQVATQPGTRLVRNAHELQDVLVAAIGKLDVKLQGETSAASDLWDQTGRTRGQEKFCPKDENHLSDWIKRHLEDELEGLGIAVAREPEIRRGEGVGKGEEIDIHVTATVPGLTEGSFEQVRVIIEAKGCWHKELKTAMQTQLVGRYLKDNPCQHGIYLVGWYVCPQWDDSDYRRGDVPKWSLEEARGNFQKQAEGLSKDGLSIRSVVINAALR